tara:strand:+ start:179 stop:637 length:459 start_codon:yes stop_codon:yes gene_type:complete
MELNSTEDTFRFSKKFGNILSGGDIIFIFGEIGVGKTTFVRGLINSLEIKNGIKISEILSPTFNLLFSYKINKIKVMHYDLFRLKKVEDIDELGIFMDTKDHIILIEWPDLIKKKPKDRIEIFFNYLDENFIKRNFEIKGHGKWKNYDFKKI